MFFSALLHTRYEGSKDDGKIKKHKFCPVLCTSNSIFILWIQSLNSFFNIFPVIKNKWNLREQFFQYIQIFYSFPVIAFPSCSLYYHLHFLSIHWAVLLLDSIFLPPCCHSVALPPHTLWLSLCPPLSLIPTHTSWHSAKWRDSKDDGTHTFRHTQEAVRVSECVCVLSGSLEEPSV